MLHAENSPDSNVNMVRLRGLRAAMNNADNAIVMAAIMNISTNVRCLTIRGIFKTANIVNMVETD